MESGGGTRMGSRSSTRYGPASVFSGPVRKWRKRWTPIPSSSPSPSPSPSPRLYKWMPITKDDDDPPATRRLRYLPVSVIEEQRKEAARKAAEEAQTTEAAMPAIEDSNKFEDPMAITKANEDVRTDVEEFHDHASNSGVAGTQELNRANLELSLCFKAESDNLRKGYLEKGENDGHDHNGDSTVKTEAGAFEKLAATCDAEIRNEVAASEIKIKKKPAAQDVEMRDR
eukprot:Gb_18599 [translate_table: standard]